MMRAALRSLATALVVVALGSVVPALAATTTRVTGKVVDAETLQPLAGAEVEIQNEAGGAGYYRTRSDDKGEFVVEGVATSRYYLFTVSRNDYADWALESWQFPATQQEARVVVPLERAGVIRVNVTGADGKTPLANARVHLRTERVAQWWEGSQRDPEPKFTSKAGEVVFDGLRSGYWALTVEGSGGLQRQEAGHVPVRRGETTPLTFKLVRSAALAGSVRLADSTAVAGVNVIARGPGEATATTDASGWWSLGELAPGRWRVEVQHDGFEPGVARDGIMLAAGESRELAALRVTPRAPSFSFVLNREVFAPEEKQQFGLRAFRVGQVDMTVWRMPTARLLDTKRDFRAAYVQGTDTTGLARVESWTHRVEDGPPFAWREAEMALPHELPAGVYVLEGRSGRMVHRALFFVSDLSLVVKRSPSRTVVWAGSLRTGLPLADVAVFTTGPGRDGIDPGNGQQWPEVLGAARARRAVTDADGLVSIPSSGDGSRSRIVAITEKNGVAIAESPLSGEAQSGGDKLFLFTERPIYRPGQTIHWKLFARHGVADGYAMPAPGDVTLTLSGPDGATLEVGGATLSASGSANGDVEVPADTPLGEWTLSATAGNASGSAGMAIQQYRKPDYKVEVTPDRPVYVNGDDVRFRVASTYFFGAPVVGATVRYTLFESRLRGQETWEQGVGEDGEEEGGYGRMLESGEARTDVDGRVSLGFTPQRVAYDRRLSLEVEVVDGAQRAVSARGTAIVGRGLFSIQVKPVRSVFAAGAPVVIDLHTLDHEGKPLSAAVTLELDQDVWNPLERRYTRSSRPLTSVVAQTSVTQGFVRVTLSSAVARSGYLRVRAKADDARGNRITAESSFWVFDDKIWSYAYRYPSLEVLADRASYAPGDTANLLVNTDVRDAAVLVSVEGRELREISVRHLFGSTGMVRIPVTAADAPNFFVAIHVRRGREVHSRVLELPVRGERHDLAITLTPDRATYKPQDKATWTLETRDAAGKPVSAEVALGVVDEAIYSLRADDTPAPHDIFFGRRPNWVTTVVSFPTLYYGGADKADHGEVRRDFRDVALWAPTVRTGADGRAQVALQYPDNLTTWRATARGITDATLVGTAVARTLVTKDIVARLALPRSFTAGDEATVTSIVNNRTTAPLTGVSEALTLAGAARLVGAGTATSNLAAGGESRSRWSVAALAESPRDGSDAAATFTFRARAKTDGDALEQVVPVLPRAVKLLSHGAGALDAASQSVAVALPADLVRTGSSLELELSPSPAAAALAASEYLTAYPYGCTEQTSNALRPALALLGAARRAAVDVPLWSDPEKRLTPFLQRLGALQQGDGGWSWWERGDVDPYMTALALDALARANAAGIQTDLCRGMLRNAQYGIERIMADVRSADGLAYCALHLAPLLAMEDAEHEFDGLRNVAKLLAGTSARYKDQLGTAGLACAAVASARAGSMAPARELLDLLAKRARTDGSGLTFPADDESAWFGDGIGNSAYALSAFAAVAPDDARGDEIVRALLARRTGRDWRNTRVTGEAAVALAEWVAARPARLAGPGDVRVSFNGESVFSGPLGGTASPFAGARVRIPGGKLRGGANDLTLARSGAGRLHWAYLAQANVPSPGPVTTDARLSVRREYLRAARTVDRRGRPRWLVSAIDDKAPIRVGETIMVRLTLTAAKDTPWLLVEDPKPAGFEIDQVLPEGVDRPWSVTGEARDDRAVFFASQLDKGDTVIEYLLRPEVTGAFTALPTSAGPMYDPDLRVRGAEARLRVTP